MRLIVSFLLLIGFIALVSCTEIRTHPAGINDKIRYDNYVVYKLHIKNKSQLVALHELAENDDKHTFWKDYDEISKNVQIMVSPDERKNFPKRMLEYGLKNMDIEVMIPNVQAIIDLEEMSGRSSPTNGFNWTRYYKLHEIEAWLDSILKIYSNVTEEFIIGKSYEGRPIRGIKISYKTGNPGIFIESNVHGREWITSATTTWFINQLLTSQDVQIRNLAENYDWYIIPVFNVDGFVYSHEKDRLWRKTRQNFSSSACIGTDINRNFDSYWMANNGASSKPCREIYAGPKPFSEPETIALAEYVSSIKNKIKVYIAFHSFGQYVLSPYGHTKYEFPDNYNDLQNISKAFVDAVKQLTYGTQYRYGSTSSVLYCVSGSSVDWVFNTQDVKVAYTIEFRDDGYYDFILPPVLIIPNCEEVMAGMLALIAKTKDLGYI